MYIPIYQLSGYDPDEEQALTARWETTVGNGCLFAVSEALRSGAGENFLQAEFQKGDFAGLIESERDLRGIKLFELDVTFPGKDDIAGRDFTYAEFFENDFIGAAFLTTEFAFARLRNCRFTRCSFSSCTFFGCWLQDVGFDQCDFGEGSTFINCWISSSRFKRPFCSRPLFGGCRFDSNTEVDDPSLRPNVKAFFETSPKIFADFHFAVSESFREGGARDQEWDHFYRARKAESRFNVTGRFAKAFRLLVVEGLIGYGERPGRIVFVSVAVVLVYGVLYMFSGLALMRHGVLETLNYDLSLRLPSLSMLHDYGQSAYFSAGTFATVSYGDISPTTSLSQVLAVSEMLLGLTLMGGFIATLYRRLTR